MSTGVTWRPPPARPQLAGDEVHVWRAPLDLPAARVQALQRTLSPDELDRAGRFRFERDGRRFVVARGLLRTILGHYLGIDAGRLRFRYNPYGKPSLASAHPRRGIAFNLSHSHGWALYAITRKRAVGIDIERIRPDFAGDDVARQFFSQHENAALQRLSAEHRVKAFFACWTRKEAYIKARGRGLSIPLDRFSVSLAPGEPAMVMSAHARPRPLSAWSLRELAPGSGFAAAIAVAGSGWRLACWSWPELVRAVKAR